MPDRELGSHDSCLLVYKPHRGLCSEARWDSKQLLFQTALWTVKNYSAQENTLWCNTHRGSQHTGCLYVLLFTSGDFKVFHRLRFKHFLIYIFEETHMQSTVFPTFNYGLEFHRGKQSNDKHNQREVKSNSHRESCSDASNTNTVAMDGRNNLYISKTFYYFYFPNFLKGFPQVS